MLDTVKMQKKRLLIRTSV